MFIENMMSDREKGFNHRGEPQPSFAAALWYRIGAIHGLGGA
jgi:hypothetical protein